MIFGDQQKRRSHWTRGLKGGSEVASLLGFPVRNPPRAWKSVSCECRVLSSRGLCDGPMAPPESYIVCVCVSVSVCECECACECVCECECACECECV